MLCIGPRPTSLGLLAGSQSCLHPLALHVLLINTLSGLSLMPEGRITSARQTWININPENRTETQASILFPL